MSTGRGLSISLSLGDTGGSSASWYLDLCPAWLPGASEVPTQGFLGIWGTSRTTAPSVSEENASLIPSGQRGRLLLAPSQKMRQGLQPGSLTGLWVGL